VGGADGVWTTSGLCACWFLTAAFSGGRGTIMCGLERARGLSAAIARLVRSFPPCLGCAAHSVLLGCVTLGAARVGGMRGVAVAWGDRIFVRLGSLWQRQAARVCSPSRTTPGWEGALTCCLSRGVYSPWDVCFLLAWLSSSGDTSSCG